LRPHPAFLAWFILAWMGRRSVAAGPGDRTPVV